MITNLSIEQCLHYSDISAINPLFACFVFLYTSPCILIMTQSPHYISI